MARILVIDDDPTIQMLFSQFLEDQGHETLLADDGRKGIALLETEKPAIVITDILMPEMDGLEILLEIRKTKVDVPVIAISGGTRNLPINFLEHAKLFGASYVFKKPVPLEVLSSAVNNLLNGKKADT